MTIQNVWKQTFLFCGLDFIERVGELGLLREGLEHAQSGDSGNWSTLDWKAGWGNGEHLVLEYGQS